MSQPTKLVPQQTIRPFGIFLRSLSLLVSCLMITKMKKQTEFSILVLIGNSARLNLDYGASNLIF